jgi:creatinine amidohydrolase
VSDVQCPTSGVCPRSSVRRPVSVSAGADRSEVVERGGGQAAARLGRPPGSACSHEHAGFAGTVSISARTLVAVVTDIADSLRASAVDRLAIVNGHGGNYVLANVVQEANTAGPRMTLFPNQEDWEAACTAAGLRSTASDDMHAGEAEVSMLLHTNPEWVRDGYQHADWQANPRPHLLVTGMRGYTDSGVIGLPSLATAEKGRAILDSLTRSFKDHLEVLS